MATDLDFSQVIGNDEALVASARAVARRERLVLLGPPGTGKTMIARRLPLLMNVLSEHERAWLEAEYCGVFGRIPPITARPFRAPHHTISTAALCAGTTPYGALDRPIKAACRCKQIVPDRPCLWHELPKGPVPRAGEARLARFGMLFLDELQEFTRSAIEGLVATLRDMGDTAPLIIAAANRCPCGWSGFDAVRMCTCSDSARARYWSRVEWALHMLGISAIASVEPVSLADMRSGVARYTTDDLREIGGAS